MPQRRIFPHDDKHQFQQQQPQQQQQQQQQHWIPDERDNFISWLRSEFAASNAIIDAMCQHLQAVGAPGEYDFVLNCVRQRRFNWIPILNMQQYFSVEEVILALQQVAVKRRQMHPGRALGSWNDRFKSESDAPDPKEVANSSAKGIAQEQPQVHNANAASQDWALIEPEGSSDLRSPKCFQSQEIVDGRPVDVLDGLKVWEVFNAEECEQITSMMGDLEGVGRKVDIGGRGHKLMAGKRFAKGKGSTEQPQHDQSSNEERGSSPEEMAEALPGSLEVIVSRLLERQILPASKRPDSYIISFLGEEGYLLPQIHNQEFEQPFCIVLLQSESSFVFGRFILMDSPGEFRGPFRLSLSPGSVVSLQGNAAKIARYAVQAASTKRCCVVLGKALARRASSRSSSNSSGFQQQRSSNSNSSSGSGSNSSGSGLITRPASTPNFATLSSPALHHPPFLLPGWSVPRPPPRLMTGTGVFLPYNAGPTGRAGGSGRARTAPPLQKTSSLPASFRSVQNGTVNVKPDDGPVAAQPQAGGGKPAEEDSAGIGHETAAARV